MCRRRILLIGSLVLLVVGGSRPANGEVGAHVGGAYGGGALVGGTPVAIAINAPSGSLATWSRRGGDNAPGPRWTCGYHQFENGSSSGISISIDYSTGPVQPAPGRIYGLVCRDQAGQLVYSWFGVYDPADPFAGLLAAQRAAELALERLVLSDPVVRFNPPGDQLVGLQSWLWVDTPWMPVEASAGVSGVTATVVARPEWVRWELGDGTSLTCTGPSAAYDATRPPDGQASTCTHAYAQPSVDRPAGVYAVSATVSYAVAWHATDGGADDLGAVTRTTTVPVRVVEVQAVID